MWTPSHHIPDASEVPRPLLNSPPHHRKVITGQSKVHFTEMYSHPATASLKCMPGPACYCLTQVCVPGPACYCLPALQWVQLVSAPQRAARRKALVLVGKLAEQLYVPGVCQVYVLGRVGCLCLCVWGGGRRAHVQTPLAETGRCTHELLLLCAACWVGGGLWAHGWWVEGDGGIECR